MTGTQPKMVSTTSPSDRNITLMYFDHMDDLGREHQVHSSPQQILYRKIIPFFIVYQS